MDLIISNNYYICILLFKIINNNKRGTFMYVGYSLHLGSTTSELNKRQSIFRDGFYMIEYQVQL